MSAGAPRIAKASLSNFTQRDRSCGRPCKKAVETSAVQPIQEREEDTDKKIERLSLDVVGAAVASLPSRASRSVYPRTINRALARGEPSGFFDHFSSIRLDKVLVSSALAAISNYHTPFSKNEFSSFTLVATNCCFSHKDMFLSESSGFLAICLAMACFCCLAAFLAGSEEYIANSLRILPLSWYTVMPVQAVVIGAVLLERLSVEIKI